MNLKSFHELPSLAKPLPEPVVALSSRNWLKGMAAGIKSIRQGRELVAGGDVLWKPINKQAALLLSKSDPIFKPNQNMSFSSNMVKLNGGEVDQIIVKNATKAEQNAAVGRKIIKAANAMPPSAVEFADDVQRARTVLENALDAFRSDVFEFCTKEMPQSVEKARQWRMTIERETTMSLRALQDLRKFFLESDHEKEMLRLSEFVRVVERLGALAKDGTLDKVAEVMLKLA